MSFKNFHYTDIDGEHFPDAILGSNLYYGLDLECWLTNESDSLVSVVWNVPEGIISCDDFVQGFVANVKLQATRTGSFIINCVMTSEETVLGKTIRQEKSIDTVLKVF